MHRPIERFVWHQIVQVEHPQSAIREGDYKLIYFWDSKEAQLFDLKNDLGERQDIAKDKPEIADALQSELKAHIKAGLGENAFAALERGEFGNRRGKGKGPRRPERYLSVIPTNYLGSTNYGPREFHGQNRSATLDECNVLMGS